MFSWICPQCGREVPPSRTDCPDCAERAKQMAAASAAQQPPAGWQPPPPQAPPAAPWQQPVAGWQQPQAAPPQAWQPAPPAPPPQQPPPPQPQWPPAATAYAPPQPEPPAYAAPPPQYAPPPQQYAPPPPQHPQYVQQPPAAWPPPESRSTPPAWLVGVGTAVVFLLLGAGIYYFLNRSDSTSPTTASQDKTGAATAGDAAKGKVTNPLQKYVEVVGIRMTTQDKQPVAKFVVVNHSGAEIVNLAANITLLASTSRSDEDSVGTFSFKIPSIGAGDSKELTAPLKTKLKPYELPDWQNTTAEVQITSPAQ